MAACALRFGGVVFAVGHGSILASSGRAACVRLGAGVSACCGVTLATVARVVRWLVRDSSVIWGLKVSDAGSPSIHVATYENGQRVDMSSHGPDALDQIFDDISGSSGCHVIVVEALGSDGADEIVERIPLPTALKRDILTPNPRPRIDRIGDASVTVLRPAAYSDRLERVTLSSLHLVLTESFLVILHRDMPGAHHDLSARELFGFATPDELTFGSRSAYLRVMDEIAADYIEVADELTQDVDDVELQVFAGDVGAPAHIYRLNREVLELERAVVPLADSLVDVLDDLEDDAEHVNTVDEALVLAVRHLLRKVQRTADRVVELKDLLSQILQVNAALIGQQQNEDMKKISSWAAILVIPTLVSGVYGMNFQHMPELSWRFGYPIALGLMAALCAGLYVIFKRKDWL